MTLIERTPLQPPDARIDASSTIAAIKALRLQRISILALSTLVFILIGAWGLSVHRCSSGSVHDGKSLTTNDATVLSAHAVTSQEVFVCGDTKKQDAGSPVSDPLIVWLQGGLEYSSLAGLFTENEPCYVLLNLSTTLNPYSQTNEVNVIWLDQPTDAGYSYGLDEDLDHSEDDVRESIFWFLQGFLDKHPELIGRPLFLAEESYADHYVSAAAHYIWQQQ